MGSTRWRVKRGCATRSRVLFLLPMVKPQLASGPAFRHLVRPCQGTIRVSLRFSFPQHSPCLIADTPHRSSSEKLALFFATRLTHCGTDHDSQAPINMSPVAMPHRTEYFHTLGHHEFYPDLGAGKWDRVPKIDRGCCGIFI